MDQVNKKARDALLHKPASIADLFSLSKSQRISKNTLVWVDPMVGCNVLCLHDNIIAQFHWSHDEEYLIINHAGWPTVTTKSRLNALPGVDIVQRRGVWYLNGEEWDGDWIIVNHR